MLDSQRYITYAYAWDVAASIYLKLKEAFKIFFLWYCLNYITNYTQHYILFYYFAIIKVRQSYSQYIIFSSAAQDFDRALCNWTLYYITPTVWTNHSIQALNLKFSYPIYWNFTHLRIFRTMLKNISKFTKENKKGTNEWITRAT